MGTQERERARKELHWRKAWDCGVQAAPGRAPGPQEHLMSPKVSALDLCFYHRLGHESETKN